MGQKKQPPGQDVARQQFEEGLRMVEKHPIFAPLSRHASIQRKEGGHFAPDGWAYVNADGYIHVHPKRRGTPEEWMYVLAHCLLHLGMGHFETQTPDRLWNAACDCVAARFLADLKLGKPPEGIPARLPDGVKEERQLYALLRERDAAPYFGYGVMGHEADMRWVKVSAWRQSVQWKQLFAHGLRTAVSNAVDVAAGKAETIYGGERKTLAALTKDWFISNYPLLGAIASGFKLVEEPAVCQSMQISVAAVNTTLQEIYINPAAALSADEMRFVMAHEFLHAALRHDVRCQGRDAQLWNVACDYVINGWLRKMRLGEMPYGLLYDERFETLSAESVYDRIVTDMRTFRKLATLRGVGLGDVISEGESWWENGPGVDLDAYYRDALMQGLEYHMQQARGYLPGDMVEEIRSLAHPPIPWDVELAKWFDEQFAPIEKVRTYARISRRQSSTPDIPRPAWRLEDSALEGRTFGVLLDTSGSMDRVLLARALGAVASYSVARDVNAVRVVFCDAAAYDQGVMRPEEIAGSVKVRGRGGTVLQPGVDLLDADKTFPKNAPLLIITDGGCDVLRIRGREHAFLIPRGANLPFLPKGKVFRMKLD